MNNKTKQNITKLLTGIAVVTTVCIGRPIQKDAFGDINKNINNSLDVQSQKEIQILMENDMAYKSIFRRRTYENDSNSGWERYDEIDKSKYPREELTIMSGENKLAGFLYGAENTNGLIVISLGTQESEDGKLRMIQYFADHNWKVMVYNYTGCYASEGESMIGYQQMPQDLNAVLNYVENSDRFRNVPVVLFGHSLGGYTTAATLQYGHNVKAAVIGSGFDTPRQVWVDSTVMYALEDKTKTAEDIEDYAKYADSYICSVSNGMEDFSAVDGINATDAPVLVLTGANDEMYLKKMSEIYIKRDKITNPNCKFKLIDEYRHDTHNEYWYTDEAADYRHQIESGKLKGNINKELYNKLDVRMLDYVNDFYLRAVSK